MANKHILEAGVRSNHVTMWDRRDKHRSQNTFWQVVERRKQEKCCQKDKPRGNERSQLCSGTDIAIDPGSVVSWGLLAK